MSLGLVTRAPASAHGRNWGWVASGAVAVAAALGLGAAIVQPGLLRAALAVAILAAAIALAVRAPNRLVFALVAWLIALGLVRRLLDTVSAPAGSGFGDPLLLVEPAVLVALTLVAAHRGAFRDRSRLANAVLLLNALAIVEVVNPAQGGLLVGIAGLLFVFVPMTAFWVGRALLDDRRLGRVLLLFAALAGLAALYGLFQTFDGLPSWDAAWVRDSGYTSLRVGGAIRAFGSFSSASEYGSALGIGVVVAATGLARTGSRIVALATLGLFGVGIFYESGRGVLILTVVALLLMWAARHRLHAVGAFVVVVLGVVVLFIVARHSAGAITSGGTASTAVAALAQHQIAGLANPLNSTDSTLSGHFSEMVTGLRITVTHPLGYGTGAASIASSRFGGIGLGTEVDPSNLGVDLGILGLLGYLVVAVTGLSAAYRMAARGTWVAWAALGTLVVVFLQWANGGQYAVAWLPWLILGWADRCATAPDLPFRASG